MYGVKLYAVPEDLDSTIELWHQMKFDTLFIGQECKKDIAFLKRLQKEKFFVNLVEPVFLADKTVNEKRLAVTEDGRPAVKEWVRFVCPSDKRWMHKFYNRLRKDSKLAVNSLSLDFIRFFQFWEIMNPKDDSTRVIRTCYCKKCNRQKHKYFNESMWRSSLINSIASKCRRIINFRDSKKLMGMHIVPWKKDALNGAGKKILGQDLMLLSDKVNFFTPMVYHHMMNEPVSYIPELLQDFQEQTENKVKIIPSIQVRNYYRPEKISLEEFRQSLELSLKDRSGSAIFFQWTDIENCKEIKDFLLNHSYCKKEAQK